jgi:hypothetical protein
MQLLFNHLHSLVMFSCIVSDPVSCILWRMFPFHLFPAHFSLSIFPVKSSHWRLFRKKLLHTEVLRYFPAHLLLYIFPISIVSLPTFPYPCSLSEAVSGVWFTRIPSTAEFVCFPSLLLPSHCSLPTFPIFDYFPAHLSSLMISCCLYKLLQWQIMCELFKWTEQSDYVLCTVCVPPPWLLYSLFMQNCVLLLVWLIFEWAPCQSNNH